MARSVDMAYCRLHAGKKKDNSGDMDKLIDAVNENFTTFREWNDLEAPRQLGGALLERFKSNYNTFMKW